ncbi:MAG: hypothetical protein EU532_01670 [Promethearchaeota archaeon]|nr:MAG: hypothetical protein EU532_01670 [Candidatus Lokiarchaeota archaeon]
MVKKPELEDNLKAFTNEILRNFGDYYIGPKVMKAISMFRKERNLLYIDKTEGAFKAVIKSQSQPHKYEYACTLRSDGSYFCSSQNLYRCGGLRGGVCKHIILSLIAIIKQGNSTSKELIGWLKNSLNKKAILDKPEATAIFLKYKNALEGKIEWRPVEIYPEDFMAF